LFLNKQTRQITGIVVAAGLVLMLLFNIFGAALEHVTILPVHPLLIVPFVLLLGSIAFMPFINKYWWEEHYPFVSFILAALVFAYYFFILNNVPRVFLTSYEYISFISLVGSLFIVTGGIHVKIPGKTTPVGNVAILATGAILANILGTTGASMLLIRPFLRVNKYRIKGYHIVFFIFLISNIGGALTPIGDPPLFLGFLKGIPFFWITSRVGSIWAVAVGLLLLVFYILDMYYFRMESRTVQHRAAELDEPEVTGLHNIIFLILILGSVFIEPPAPLLLREMIMWIAALGSYFTTKKELREKNEFNFLPIKEVAILFAGIFATMIPALDWLELNAAKLNIVTPEQYYWGSGILSSVLDNAPTYLNFLTAAFGLHGANVDNVHHMNLILGLTPTAGSGFSNPLQPQSLLITMNSWKYVQAISVGAVFFGAVTYIGNGPNFMVKSIAEQAQVRCPSFFGYILRYSLPILLPIFILIWLLFFHGSST
jgi:Na+/H+ antiporter NhaD/arsenite permease-like protein